MKRKEFLKILESVKPGVAAKDVIESMTYFFFSGTNVIAYNNKISIQYPFKSDFSLFVKADDLHKVIARLPSDDFKMDNNDGKLNIRCKSTNVNLATIQDEEVSERIDAVKKSLAGAKWKNLPDNFCEGISLCSFAASSMESDGTLTCVYVTENNCLASDNMRIAHAKINGKVDQMFIKSSEIKNLNAIEPIKYSITKAWLHFRNESNCVFSIRKTEGKFPDFLQFFDFEGTKVTFPKTILDGMDIASIFTDDVQPSIEIKIEKGVCHLSIKSDSGSAQYRTKIDYPGKAVKFSVNPDFLKEMMNHSSSIIVTTDKARLETENFALITALYN